MNIQLIIAFLAGFFCLPTLTLIVLLFLMRDSDYEYSEIPD